MMELVFAMTGTPGFVNCAAVGRPSHRDTSRRQAFATTAPTCGRAAANRAAQARFRAKHKGSFSRQKRKRGPDGRKPDLNVTRETA